MLNSLGAFLCLQSTIHTPARVYIIYIFMGMVCLEGMLKISLISCLIRVSYSIML